MPQQEVFFTVRFEGYSPIEGYGRVAFFRKRKNKKARQTAPGRVRFTASFLFMVFSAKRDLRCSVKLL